MSAGYLVDTGVLSAGAPSKVQATSVLLEWMDRNSARLYVSVVTVAEIEDGIAKSKRRGSTRKAAALREWLETLVHLYRSRLLPFDLDAARIAGALSDRARGRGYEVGFADLAIGATAKRHHLTVLTRNLKHFDPLGVAAHDPVNALPLD